MSHEPNSVSYKSIDLFAGIGGIRLGFERAFKNSIETNFVCEWDEKAQETYRKNFNDSFEITGDINNVNIEEMKPFDICLAGFPCQAFSILGKKMGFDDYHRGNNRGILFFEVVKICKVHRPKVIFCENVKGLTSHKKGETFDVIKKTLDDIGYDVYSAILNSKYFGVAQNRERVYIVAFRKDIDSSKFKFPEGFESKVCINDILEEKVPSTKYYLSDVYLETLRKHKETQKSRGFGYGYVIRDTSGIAGALLCGGMGRERNLIVDKRITDYTPVTKIKGEVNREGVRKLTPREWARLQGFPEEFDIDGIADTHLYKQFGNTVTVPVIEAIAKEIKNILDVNL